MTPDLATFKVILRQIVQEVVREELANFRPFGSTSDPLAQQRQIDETVERGMRMAQERIDRKAAETTKGGNTK